MSGSGSVITPGGDTIMTGTESLIDWSRGPIETIMWPRKGIASFGGGVTV